MESGFLFSLQQFVKVTNLHPILVNFTAALIPVSVANDYLARYLKNKALREVSWWTLFYAVIITPFTAISGWLFWMKDDMGVQGMMIHKWLGTTLAVLLIGLCMWRWKFYRQEQWASFTYLTAGFVFVGLLIFQGHLGGSQVFKDM